jgi:hypothetical protein
MEPTAGSAEVMIYQFPPSAGYQALGMIAISAVPLTHIHGASKSALSSTVSDRIIAQSILIIRACISASPGHAPRIGSESL